MQTKKEVDTFKYVLIDKQMYITNYSLEYNEIFNFFFCLSKNSIVEYNTNLLTIFNLRTRHSQNLFLNNFDKIEFVTIIGGG